MVNYRPPPDKLARDFQVVQMDSWCRYDPMPCLAQVAIESLFVAASYSSLILLTGGSVPKPLAVVSFLVVFIVLNAGARMISEDLGNKLSIAAVSSLGMKAASILAPKIVSW